MQDVAMCDVEVCWKIPRIPCGVAHLVALEHPNSYGAIPWLQLDTVMASGMVVDLKGTIFSTCKISSYLGGSRS